jgi:hypothetical protein
MQNELKESIKQLGFESRKEFIDAIKNSTLFKDKKKSLYTQITQIINGTRTMNAELEDSLRKAIVKVLDKDKNKFGSKTDIEQNAEKIVSQIKRISSEKKETLTSDYLEVCKDLENADSALSIAYKPLLSLGGNTNSDAEQLRNKTVDYIFNRLIPREETGTFRELIFNLPDEDTGINLWRDMHRLMLSRLEKEKDQDKINLLNIIKKGIILSTYFAKKKASVNNKETAETLKANIQDELDKEFEELGDEKLLNKLLILLNENKNIMVYMNSGAIFSIPVVVFNRFGNRPTGYYKLKRTNNGQIFFLRIEHIEQWVSLTLNRIRSSKPNENKCGISILAKNVFTI